MADPRERPTEIHWVACTCGSPHCHRQHPTNMGSFYQGTGFEPEEVEWLNQAWAALNQIEGRPVDAHQG